MTTTGKTASFQMSSTTTTLVFQRRNAARWPSPIDQPGAPLSSQSDERDQAPHQPAWLRWVEAIAIYASFALLAFVLLGCWLTLMQANDWI
ncbi:hypothetical protein ASG43_08485 [Aureimonas sp. Leaf454]|uniref:hypothetical protein n=1 Tax=Aureimonas sp. Leaf454 TaxID=1736381 RepID=UPI0006F90B4A|nr:hypothetical protein [Aureimonas sp. Leaf454]KQT48871.1 hypothetical protein ASG43_08485 [Aureimonas sp. Leaf454]